jgi:glycosyltransferase involved in cell wall biosynthesis
VLEASTTARRADGTATDRRPFHVGLDLTALLPQATGVDRYITELVAALARVGTTVRFTLFLNHADRERFGGLPPRFDGVGIGYRNRAARLVVQQARLPVLCAALGIDVLHSPAFLMPWLRGRTRHVVTVHDMTFFSMPHVHTRLRRSVPFRQLVLGSIRRASAIAVPTVAVRDELLERVPGIDPARVRVTPYGVSSCFATDSAGDATRLQQLAWLPSAPFVLSVGTLEPRKNLPVLIEAFRRLVDGGVDLDLVLAGGPGQAHRSINAAVAASGLARRIHLPGFVPDSLLPALYRRARVFAYPSLDEGFGFPPLEAMASGVPVVASARSALAENLRGAALLVTPDEPDALAAAIRTSLCEDEARASLIGAGLERAARFSWDETARLTMAAYIGVATESAAGWSRGRPETPPALPRRGTHTAQKSSAGSSEATPCAGPSR